MGGSSRKSKGQSATTNLIKRPSPVKETDHVDYMRDVEQNVFLISWKEIIWLLGGVFAFATLSIIVGVAAGISISIHYYEDTASQYDVHQRQHQRVTILDQSIVSSNVLKIGRDDLLGRVITPSKTGQRDVLLVVEESPMNDGERGMPMSTSSGMGHSDRGSPALLSNMEPPRIEWNSETRRTRNGAL
jgi:hypothetical protein